VGVCLCCGSRDYIQENCCLQPAKLLTKVEKVYKRPQKRSKVISLSVKKKTDVKEVFTNDFKAKDLGKE
jgi:hypothetical protein